MHWIGLGWVELGPKFPDSVRWGGLGWVGSNTQWLSCGRQHCRLL